MSTLQITHLSGLIRTFKNDLLWCIPHLDEILYYLEEYRNDHGDLTKELIRDQIDFNLEEIEDYVDGCVLFRDWLREIIDGVLDEDSRNAEIYVD